MILQWTTDTFALIVNVIHCRAKKTFCHLSSTSESRHTTQCTGHVSVVFQLWRVSSWGLMKRRLVLPYVPLRLGKDFTYIGDEHNWEIWESPSVGHVNTDIHFIVDVSPSVLLCPSLWFKICNGKTLKTQNSTLLLFRFLIILLTNPISVLDQWLSSLF